MNHCFSTLQALIANGRPAVLVTVAYIAGSAPREPGARMIVTATEVMGTIGGGNLEFEAIRIARARLDDAGAPRYIELFPLGPMLQQCCGGAVFLHFEVVREQSNWLSVAAQGERDNTPVILASRTRGDEPDSEKIIFTPTALIGSLGDKHLDELAKRQASVFLSNKKNNEIKLLKSLVETESSLPNSTDALFFEMISPCSFHVALFGAGHVGRALVNTLAVVPDCHITWVDSRPDQFPSELPANVEARPGANPPAEVETLPGQAYCLVMTHDHQLDQDICEALLRRNDVAFLGLIGSATKQRRFMQRLREKGITEQQLERLTCPIGIPGIESKEPGVIAISVAAQLYKMLSADDAN